MKRLSKAKRREQLLESALEILAQRGADALTLVSLAEHAGISKPVVYDHFRTRAGLLIALYRQIDDRHVQSLLAALAHAPRRLREVARVVSEAYVDCTVSVGPQWLSISAALKGDPEMDAAQTELIDRYVDLYRRAFAPYCSLPAGELQVRCVGILGAAEAISRELMRGRTGRAKAVAALASLITSALAG